MLVFSPPAAEKIHKSEVLCFLTGSLEPVSLCYKKTPDKAGALSGVVFRLNTGRSRFLVDNLDAVIITTAATNFVRRFQLATVGASGECGNIQFPDCAASFISSCLRYFSLRYCHR